VSESAEREVERLNFLDDDPWDEVDEADRTRRRWFGHPLGAEKLGASLIDLGPRAPDSPLHMHYGVEEMFFVLSGTPTLRTPAGEEQLSPGDVVYFPEGPDGLHTFSNSSDEPARILGVSSKRFPDVVAYPNVASPGSRRGIRSGPCLKAATRGSSLASTFRARAESASAGAAVRRL
jgi:uncharacterized cupin superfamily protein